MATNDKYTMRKFLENVKAGNVTDVEKEFAAGEIVKMDARNEARKGKETKAQKENAPIKDAILAYIKENPGVTAEAIAKALTTDEKPLTTAKVSALATQLKDAGAIKAEDVKKADGKGKVKAYTLA